MTFDEVLEQIRDLLRSKGRVSYRALKRRFALDDEYLEDLKAEIIKAEQLAIDEDGEVLVWTGGTSVSGSRFQVSSLIQSPSGGGGRRVFPQGHRDCSPATSEIAGAAGGDELGAFVAESGQAGRSSADAR